MGKMDGVLEGIRRVVYKWVNTSSPINSADPSALARRGDTEVSVRNAGRFEVDDQVMIRNATVVENGLTVKSVDYDNNIVEFTTPLLNDWPTDLNSILVKTIYNNFIQGVYLGDPEVIPMYPAITINGVSRSSEWLTLESTKERYEIEISVYVLDSTHEEGYKFLMETTDTIQLGLKRNIMPLIENYNIISLAEDITAGDINIKVNNREKLNDYRRIIIEDLYDIQEVWVDELYSSDSVSIQLQDAVCLDYSASDTSVIVPQRFIYNSWPADIDYGKIHKGELLKASVIHWFAEEEEMQFLRREEMKLM